MIGPATLKNTLINYSLDKELKLEDSTSFKLNLNRREQYTNKTFKELIENKETYTLCVIKNENSKKYKILDALEFLKAGFTAHKVDSVFFFTIKSTTDEFEYFGRLDSKASLEVQKFVKASIKANGGDAKSDCLLGIFKLEEKSKGYDPKGAFDIFTNLAIRGHAAGQFWLAKCLEKGIGTEPNLNCAIRWYLESAMQGNSDALNKIAGMKEYPAVENYYHLCKLFNKAYNGEAFSFSEILNAADEKNPLAQHFVGLCKQYGYGTDKDIQEAISWHLKAEKNSGYSMNYLVFLVNEGHADANPVALNALAFAKNHGIYIKTDIPGAIELYNKSATLGDKTALLMLQSLSWGNQKAKEYLTALQQK